MKKRIFLVIFFFLFPLNSFSLEIAIVDIDYLINVSKKGKKLQNELSSLSHYYLSLNDGKNSFLTNKKKTFFPPNHK